MNEEEQERLKKKLSDEKLSDEMLKQNEEVALKMAQITSPLNELNISVFKKSEKASIIVMSSIISGLIWVVADNYDDFYSLLDKVFEHAKTTIARMEKDINKNV